MSKVLIIGAGGVGRVVTHKCAQLPEVFEEICLASRTEARCRQIAGELSRPIQTAQVDANNVRQTLRLIERFKPDVVINVALPYQNLPVMDACLRAKVHYVDTSADDDPNHPKFDYGAQWAWHKDYHRAGITGLLSIGFDPGVVNVFCAYAKKHLFDRIDTIDIIDCNAGDHGLPFATNFDPETNLREILAPGRYWENGQWQITEPLACNQEFDFPEIGPRRAYLMYHEELESIAKFMPGVKRVRFWMTFTEKYLTHLKVLRNVGLTSIEPIEFEGRQIVPLQFLKAVLPNPASLGQRTKGKTCIGTILEGQQNGKPRKLIIYNVCDHEAAYREVGSQAISYTTGVPAMIGAKLILQGTWRKAGVYNPEQFDPDPFMEDLNRYGLPWHIKELS